MTRREPAALSALAAVPGEMAELMALAELSIRAVLDDRTVWAEESSREGAAPLPWPLEQGRDGYPALLRVLASTAVENVLESMRLAEGLPEPIPVPADGSDPEFQVVLRVCKRAVDAADAAVLKMYGDAGRITDTREFWNWLKRWRIEQAARSGLKGKRAAEAAGLGVASSYRAQHRKPKGKR